LTLAPASPFPTGSAQGHDPAVIRLTSQVNAYTGLIFSALIEPGSRAAVCRALVGEVLADGDQAGSSPVAVRWPNRGVDLIVECGDAAERRVILMEHKRFRSPSHAPGYRTDPDALWQTDQVYESVSSAAPPAWFDGLGPAADLTYLVLDVHGKTMDQMDPGGRHNKAWQVTGYREFGSALPGAAVVGLVCVTVLHRDPG
jgi:hypothetical protein